MDRAVEAEATTTTTEWNDGGRSRKRTKVPILGDIPILGYLFRSENTTQEKVELLIFLTPHLMGPGEEAVEGFEPRQHFLEEKNRFPEIRKQLSGNKSGQ